MPHKGYKQTEAHKRKVFLNRHGKAITHNLSSHPIYPIWRGIFNRCYSTGSPLYKWYGGRGITVSKEWHDIKKFVADLEQTYFLKAELDRLNNNLGYSKENCRWVTSKINNRNRKDNVLIEYKGQKLCLSEWAEKLGVKVGTLWARFKKSTMSLERAMTPGSLRIKH